MREIHARAYDWEPPPLAEDARLSTTSMRQYVRRWINEWDLLRLDPEHPVETVVVDLKMSYAENLLLAASDEEDARPGS